MGIGRIRFVIVGYIVRQICVLRKTGTPGAVGRFRRSSSHLARDYCFGGGDKMERELVTGGGPTAQLH